MKEPVDHILRPRLPWRSDSDPAITECGYDASKVKTLTREEFRQRLKDYGKQRTAILTCMTCSDTAQRYPTWEEDPRRALEREIVWECGWRGGDRRGTRLKDELNAIAALIEQNAEQFATIKANIEHRRDWIEKKAEREKKPAVQADRPPGWKPL